jgi:hypothetical protein
VPTLIIHGSDADADDVAVPGAVTAASKVTENPAVCSPDGGHSVRLGDCS